MTNIAVIGPGAIGGTVAVCLEKTLHHSVVVCARSRLTRLMIEAAEGQLSAVPSVILSPEQGRPCNWVLVTTKAYDAVSTGAWLPRLFDAKTRLAVLQNGVEHIARFALATFPKNGYRANLSDSLIASVLDSYRNGQGDAINSLHGDRLAGRPFELDARNGAVVRLGRKHGIETPVNQMIVAPLEAAI